MTSQSGVKVIRGIEVVHNAKAFVAPAETEAVQLISPGSLGERLQDKLVEVSDLVLCFLVILADFDFHVPELQSWS